MADHCSKRQQFASPLVCVGCHVDLAQSSVVQIEDGGGKYPDYSHRLCILCFGNLRTNQSSNLTIKCPAKGCQRSSRQWTVYQFSGSIHCAVDQKIRLPKSDEDKLLHPVQYFSNKGHTYQNKHALLSITAISGTGRQGGNTYCDKLHAD